jgi:hypothetical protein
MIVAESLNVVTSEALYKPCKNWISGDWSADDYDVVVMLDASRTNRAHLQGCGAAGESELMILGPGAAVTVTGAITDTRRARKRRSVRCRAVTNFVRPLINSLHTFRQNLIADLVRRLMAHASDFDDSFGD